MHILICTSSATAAGHKLQRRLRTSTGVEHCDLFTSVASLNTRLRRPMRPAAIGILIPGHARDLLCFAAMRHLMGDMRIVLVLPDSRPQTISDGHALHPRFISYADSDLKDVEAVVAKMVATLQGRRSLATAETAG
jgi:hypothetical protein